MSEAAPSTRSSPRAPLRVALVMDSLEAPAWAGAVVDAIRAGGDVQLVSLSVGGATISPPPGPLAASLLRLYGFVDSKIFGRPNDPGETTDVVDAVLGIQRLGDDDPVDPGLDVVLRLGSSRVTRGTALPRYGDWTIEHGCDLPPGLRPERMRLAPGGPEMLTARPFTITQLVATIGVGDQRPIGQVVSSVDRLSLRRGSRRHLQKLPGLVARTLHAVRMDEALPEPVDEAVPATGGRQNSPGALTIGFALGRIVASFVGRKVVRLLAPERWVVAISRERPRDGADGPPDHKSFAILQAPDGREWADPFPLAVPGRDLVFLEEYVRERHRGRLIVAELDDSPRGWLATTAILELPTHLSYPFVFQWENAWYLMPEQAATGSLELYRADAFPEGWRWHSTVLQGVAAADATLAEIDGHWWLFAAIAIGAGTAADELHLFHSQSPLGPWVAHERNPVVSDVRTARPAGRLYQRGGHWYRPAQDGAISYGHSIAILQIDRIDLDGYRERVVQTIRPTWLPGLIATHTLNADAHLTAIDGLVRERRWRLGRGDPRSP